MNAQQKQDLRHVVLEIIALRHPAALTPRAISRRAATEVDFPVTDDDITAALVFLKGLGCAKAEADALGSTQYWSATSQGVLTYERGKLPDQSGQD